MTEKSIDLITILGPTAVGKTRLAALLADRLNSGVISADSRQVYKRMDLGTGKDYQDYIVNNRTIPSHLLDITEPGTEYNIFEYSRHFYQAFAEIRKQNKIPVFCGGSGLYLETILFNRQPQEVPPNHELRAELALKSDAKLAEMLAEYRQLHNTTDTSDRERLIRAIEIAVYQNDHLPVKIYPDIQPLVFGLQCERDILKKRITARLRQRLDEGMLKEVEELLNSGITKDQLMFYGLEYRYLTMYLTGEIRYNDMFQKLNSAIHQFAKRQMTFFRHLEKNGLTIHWLESEQPMEDKLEQINEIMLLNGLT